MHQKGCYDLIIFYSGVCSHSLRLFELSAACRQDFKALHTVSQTEFAAPSPPFLVYLLRNLCILPNKHACSSSDSSRSVPSPCLRLLRGDHLSPGLQNYPSLQQNPSAGASQEAGSHCSSHSSAGNDLAAVLQLEQVWGFQGGLGAVAASWALPGPWDPQVHL